MNIKKLLNLINPQPVIGGLEISNSGLRFVRIKKDDLLSAGLELPAGVVEEGKIKDNSQLTAALSKLHSQITRRKKKKIYVIVGIPDINVYTQVFNLPVIGSNQLEEAAQLNLQMVSPIDFSDAYSDWQTVGESALDGRQTEILGALAPKKIIIDFSNALEQAGFGVAAIEFPALSLTRLAVHSGTGVDAQTPYLLFRLDNDGLNLNIIKNGNLYFNHFEPWLALAKTKEGKISFSDFKDSIIGEVQKVLNFYETHWEGKVNKVILTGSGLIEETAKILSENLFLEVQPLVLQKFNQLSPDYYVALGLALRGLFPRSQDAVVSLASVGTEDKFQQYRIINFINIWRNIVFASLIFMSVVFGLTYWFLFETLESSAVLSDAAKMPEIAELNILQEEARNFNKKIEFLLQAKQAAFNWSPIFEKINNLADSAGISLGRIFIQSLETPLIINAKAPSQTAAVNFKNLLIQEPRFIDVDLPLSRIILSVDGSAEFNISFNLRNL